MWRCASEEELAGSESEDLPEFWLGIFAWSGEAVGDECVESAESSSDTGG